MTPSSRYRVSAYNTVKTIRKQDARRHRGEAVRLLGGLVPGVDVMAYMMHLPVAKWGRAFLERGLIEARFVKPVYDGEMAELTGDESNGVLVDRGPQPRRALRHRHRVVAGIRAGRFRLQTSGSRGGRGAQAGQCRLPTKSANGSARMPRDWAGGGGQANISADIRETDPIYAKEGLGHPGLLQRVMNKVLVDNAILGPWIHVGSRMQLLSAAKAGDVITARAKVIGNYDKKGHRFVELDALVVANGKTPLAHCHHIAIYQPREQAAA